MEKKEEDSPNVVNLITWFNYISNWIITIIVTSTHLKKRIALLQFFIEVSVYCLKFNNFNGVMEIVSALKQTPIYRLKETWDGLPESSIKQFTYLDDIFFSVPNSKEYRNIINIIKEDREIPCIPYVGICFQDLLTLEELSTKDKEGLINFRKLRRIADIYRLFERCSSITYDFEFNRSIHQLILNESILTPDKQIKFSRICEAKKSVKKKLSTCK